MGDYFHIVSDVDYAHLAWANTLNGEQDVYYTRVNPWFVGIDEKTTDNTLPVHVYPNPAKDNLKISFHIEKNKSVEIRLFDVMGKRVYSRTIENPGNGEGNISINTSFFPEGVYFLRVSSGNRNSVKKVVLTR